MTKKKYRLNIGIHTDSFQEPLWILIFHIKEMQLFTMEMRQELNQIPFPGLKTALFQLGRRHFFFPQNGIQSNWEYQLVFMGVVKGGVCLPNETKLKLKSFSALERKINCRIMVSSLFLSH